MGWELVLVAIDDASRVAYVETLEDERGGTAAAFLERAVSWFGAQGIAVRKVLTDNGSCYVSHPFTQLCLGQGVPFPHQTLQPEDPR